MNCCSQDAIWFLNQSNLLHGQSRCFVSLLVGDVTLLDVTRTHSWTDTPASVTSDENRTLPVLKYDQISSFVNPDNQHPPDHQLQPKHVGQCTPGTRNVFVLSTSGAFGPFVPTPSDFFVIVNNVEKLDPALSLSNSAMVWWAIVLKEKRRRDSEVEDPTYLVFGFAGPIGDLFVARDEHGHVGVDVGVASYAEGQVCAAEREGDAALVTGDPGLAHSRQLCL